eukprot:14540201-Heterocapsa_arctica.AAC.1
MAAAGLAMATCACGTPLTSARARHCEHCAAELGHIQLNYDDKEQLTILVTPNIPYYKREETT